MDEQEARGEAIRVVRQNLVDTVVAMHRSLPAGAIPRQDHVGAVAARVIDRAESLFFGVYRLLQDGQPENALLLSRPLFEESLWLLEAENSDEKRQLGLALGWWHKGTLEKRNLYRQTTRYDEGAPPDREEAIEADVRAIEQLAQDEGVRLIHPPDHKQTAQRHGLMYDYTKYLLAHQFVHGSLVVHQLRTHVDEQDKMLATIGAAAPETEWEATMFACRSAIRATKSACAVLGYTPDPELAVAELWVASVVPDGSQDGREESEGEDES